MAESAVRLSNMPNPLKVVGQGLLSYHPGRGAYMPTITPLPDGTFIAAQHVGEGLGSPDNYIEILRSKDGSTWESGRTIHSSGHKISEWSYRAPKISVVPDGRLVMTASRFEKIDNLFDPDTEELANCEMVLTWSSDGGISWSDPQVLTVPLPPSRYTWNGAGSLEQLSSDRWMYPFETWKPIGHVGIPDQKAAALFSSDQGKTWEEYRVVADDPTGKVLWWDQMNSLLPDGRVYTMFWTHLYGTQDDLNNHYAVSENQGRTWSEPRPTNLRGQVCTPIPLADGRVAAIYNYRHDPQGIHVALTEDLETFDVENEVVVFDAGKEATLGNPETENFLATHMKIAFGKPGGTLLSDGTLMTYYWCTAGGVTHTRWVRLSV